MLRASLPMPGGESRNLGFFIRQYLYYYSAAAGIVSLGPCGGDRVFAPSGRSLRLLFAAAASIGQVTRVKKLCSASSVFLCSEENIASYSSWKRRLASHYLTGLKSCSILRQEKAAAERPYHFVCKIEEFSNFTPNRHKSYSVLT